MAQWIPKTAWRVSSLNKRYGKQYTFGGSPKPLEENALGFCTASQGIKVASNELETSLLSSQSSLSNGGSIFIDIRSLPERQHKPLSSPLVVTLHAHDILSGAAIPVLPENKSTSKLYVVSTNVQRSVSTCIVLQRWGYLDVSYMDPCAVLRTLHANP